MLVKFLVENYLSFKEKTCINFQTGSIKEHQENTFLPFFSSNVSLVKSVGVFGHNASGKSNLIKAITFMKNFVLNSSKESNSAQKIEVQPFLLSTLTDSLPSAFEVIFILDEIKYRYGFSVTQKNVESEWLFITEKRKEEKLFVRAGQNYTFEKTFKAGLKGKFELFAEVTRANTLFLSVLAQFNSTLCQRISEWFDDLIIAHDTAHLNLIDFTANLMTTGDFRRMVNDIMKRSDLGIESVEEKLKENVTTQKDTFREFISNIEIDRNQMYKVVTNHLRYGKENEVVDKIKFDLLKNESLGTQKFFGILGPILLALKKRRVIWVDEIDARVHSLLLEHVISLFNSNKYNPNGAQLIFTSHNTTI